MFANLLFINTFHGLFVYINGVNEKFGRPRGVSFMDVYGQGGIEQFDWTSYVYGPSTYHLKLTDPYIIEPPLCGRIL